MEGYGERLDYLVMEAKGNDVIMKGGKGDAVKMLPSSDIFAIDNK